MKNLFAALLLGFLTVLSFTACGGEGSTPTPPDVAGKDKKESGDSVSDHEREKERQRAHLREKIIVIVNVHDLLKSLKGEQANLTVVDLSGNVFYAPLKFEQLSTAKVQGGEIGQPLVITNENPALSLTVPFSPPFAQPIFLEADQMPVQLVMAQRSEVQ